MKRRWLLRICILLISAAMIVLFLLSIPDNKEIAPVISYKNPTELLVVMKKDPSGHIQNLKREFEKENKNIRIKLIEIPTKADDGYRILMSALNNGTKMFDVCEVDDVWIPELANSGHLAVISDESIKSNDFLPKVVEGFVYDEQLYAVPYELDVDLLFYRNDVESREDLLFESDIDKVFDLPDAVCKDSMFDDEMICVLMELFNYYDGDAEKAIRCFKSYFGKTAPLLKDGWDFITAFKQKKLSTLWTSVSAQSNLDSDSSCVTGRYSISEMKNDRGESVSLLKRYGLAINKQTENYREALMFVEFCTSENNQKEQAKVKGALPIIRQFYNDPVVLDSVTYAAEMEQTIEKLKTRPARKDYMMRTEELKKSLKQYLVGEADISLPAGQLEALQLENSS